VYARAAFAPTPRRRALSDSAFVGLGLASFLVAIAAEYGLYHRFLRAPLRTHDLVQLRPALTRWIMATGAWNLLVVVGSVIYLVAVNPGRGHGVAWVAPPVGGVFGSALVLQFVVTAISRSARP
jgi:hypothetical protein